jgi:hypothetical protein
MKGKGVTMMETGAVEGNSKKYSPSAYLPKLRLAVYLKSMSQ